MLVHEFSVGGFFLASFRIKTVHEAQAAQRRRLFEGESVHTGGELGAQKQGLKYRNSTDAARTKDVDYQSSACKEADCIVTWATTYLRL
jgi:hypothetical protein